MNQHQFLFSIFFHATLKIRKGKKEIEWKEIGTIASLAGRCCNADDRIINVSNKFEKL